MKKHIREYVINFANESLCYWAHKKACMKSSCLQQQDSQENFEPRLSKKKEGTTRRSSFLASKGSTIHFFSSKPSAIRNRQMRPHLDESKGCLQSPSISHWATCHLVWYRWKFKYLPSPRLIHTTRQNAISYLFYLLQSKAQRKLSLFVINKQCQKHNLTCILSTSNFTGLVTIISA